MGRVLKTPIKTVEIFGVKVEFGEDKQDEKPKPPEIHLPTPEETKRYGVQWSRVARSIANTAAILLVSASLLVVGSILMMPAIVNGPGEDAVQSLPPDEAEDAGEDSGSEDDAEADALGE